MTARNGIDGSGWVSSAFGVRLTTDSSALGLRVEDMVELALRRNPKRAHLLVSKVLGKHIATDPGVVSGAGRLLGELIHRKLTDQDSSGPALSDQSIAAAGQAIRDREPAPLLDRLTSARWDRLRVDPNPLLVLGYAETATSLGHLVAEQLRADWYLHSTRRAVPGIPVAGRFEEGHSHATTHLLLPHSTSVLTTAGPLVLVDDEISTGKTALATIAELHRQFPRRHYVLGALLDLRSAVDETSFDVLAAELGVRIDVVSLVRGHVQLPPDLTDKVSTWVNTQPEEEPVEDSTESVADSGIWPVPWPRSVPEGGRHGISRADSELFDVSVATLAHRVRASLRQEFTPGETEPETPGAGSPLRVLVLGTEEFMYLPLRVALDLHRDPLISAMFQSTTRSPVHPSDTPGYPIRRRFVFPGTDTTTTDNSIADDCEPAPERYLYNALTGVGQEFDVVLIFADGGTDAAAMTKPGGLATELARTGAAVRIVALEPAPLPVGTPAVPAPLIGPAFGSYHSEDVGWLLTDLSTADLEGDIAGREALIQSGRAHYAESLPVEYQPDATYRALFDEVLETSAPRLAQAVGVVCELLIASRGRSDVVLASLARAGTPVGILMRRWAKFRHDLDWPHYAVSIVRGRGIDRNALEYLAAHHDPAQVVFVDGWTGKGAITRELTAALREFEVTHGISFNDDLAVLADPGYCVSTFGTRDDFLIASACLNSTVSGLVSRTVLNPDYLTATDFHGAKFYSELADQDVSTILLDAVTAQYDAVSEAVDVELAALLRTDRTPTFAGWAAIERIRQEYRIPSVNFVKPGVGETTRVLLRRLPWLILLREKDNPDHSHIRKLAADRGVPVEVRPDLPYSCVGLVKPLFETDRGEG